MRRVLLAAATAALTIASASAAAQHRVTGTGIPNATTFGQPMRGGHGFHRHNFPHNERFAHERNDGASETAWGGYELSSSYDATDWAPDNGNDWWHDRPDRAFPRWVQHNQNCTPDRMWWSGSGWHC